MEDIPVRDAEKHLQASGIDYTILRPNWYMQNFSATMAGSIKEGGIHLPAGDAKTSFIDVRDIAVVVGQVFSNNIHLNKEYDLSGPEALDHNQVAKSISDVTGNTVVYSDIPEDQYKTALMGYGLSQSSADFLTRLYETVKDGYANPVTGDVQNIIGRPPVSFDTFAKDYADAWK
jgi:uncharacterized protein YbjT (DUF2867 family)